MSRNDGVNTKILNARILGHAGIKDIAIENGRISEIGNIGGDGIDACERLVCPGFVNAHTHLDKADLLCLMNPGDFGRSLEENRMLLKKFKRGYSRQEIKKRANNVIMQFLANGVTAIRTQVDVDSNAGLKAVEAISDLAKSAPLRLQLCAFPQEGVLSENARSMIEQALDSGCDLLGGLPLVEQGHENRMRHIDVLFEIAKKHDVDLDVQIDESNDPREFMLPYLIEKTVEHKWQGRVTATHCISLSAQDENIIRETSRLLAEAGINVITTPSANLITRFDAEPNVHPRPSNSIAPLKHLMQANVNTALGTDNIRDIFYPMGNCSMMREMHIARAATRMTSYHDAEMIFEMACLNGAKILGLDYGIKEGALADLLIMDCQSPEEALNSREIVPMVISGGNIACRSNLEVNYG